MKYLAIFIALFTACNAIQVPTGPGTDYPCGVYGKSCGGGMCCGQGDVCGFTGPMSTCPAGYCCFVGGKRPAFDAGVDQ